MIGKIEETKTVETKLPDIFWLATDFGDDDWCYYADEPDLDRWDIVHRIRLTQPDYAAIAEEISIVTGTRWMGQIESILRERLG